MLFAVEKQEEAVTAAEESLAIYQDLGHFKDAELVEGFLECIGKKEELKE